MIRYSWCVILSGLLLRAGRGAIPTGPFYLTRPIDLFHVLKKELGVGIINGIVLGILIGIVAWFWKDNVYLGLVIGLALTANTILAVSIGGTVPLILKGFGIDPAVAAGPLLTTVTDMAGFFLVLSLATFFMPQLLA